MTNQAQQEVTLEQLQLTRDEWANIAELLKSANFDAAHWRNAQLSASTIAKAQAWISIIDQRANEPAPEKDAAPVVEPPAPEEPKPVKAPARKARKK